MESKLAGDVGGAELAKTSTWPQITPPQSAHAFSERLLHPSEWWSTRWTSWLSNTQTLEEKDETGPNPDNGSIGEELMLATRSGFKVKVPKNLHPLMR